MDSWVLVAAAIAVPLLAASQYGWLSELGEAQRAEVRQRWQDAVARGAAAIDADVSAFYAAMLDAGRVGADGRAIARAVAAWRGTATTLGPVTRAYVHDRGRGWVALGGTSAGRDAAPIGGIDAVPPAVPFSAAWLPAAGARTLPALTVAFDGSAEFGAVLLAFDEGACAQLLRTLAQHFGPAAQVRLAVVENRPPASRTTCADSQFDGRGAVDARTAVFRLQPRRLPSPRRDLAGGTGIVMSQERGSAAWHLLAQHGSEPLAAGVRRAQARNFWTAALLELTLVAAIVGVALAARRARRTAAAHLRFSAVVAHELRTPLAAIKVLAQNQARGLVRDERQVEQYGSTIAAEADRLHVFVERALQFTGGRGAPAVAACDAVDFERVLTNAVLPLHDRMTASGIALHTNVAPDARATFGDEGALVLAVRNLVENALEHAAGARRIRIEVRHHQRHAVVAVTDDGAGVPAPERASLFEPFVRGRSARHPGARRHGIGLALVRDVARAHGGRAWHEAAETGAMFAFTVLLRPRPRGR